jgi:hypothetical protein
MPGCEVEERHRKQEAAKPELLAIKQYLKSIPKASSYMSVMAGRTRLKHR